ncbi:transposase [Colletotrichum tofieldiae]|uniref:Transposase n=1 Tax=Colletotrichum tofieldiae TaxID=708197 RepID=A0A161W0H7_9PEZI|nr:transposase [Colletotrichum tofieldiae]
MESSCKVVFGAAGPLWRERAPEIIEVLLQAGIKEIDAAQVYQGSEKTLGDFNAGRHFAIDTKEVEYEVIQAQEAVASGTSVRKAVQTYGIPYSTLQRRLTGAQYLAIPAISAIQPANRYNTDETGILEGQGANGLVLGKAETKFVRKKQPGSRAWVSVIECISAEGRALHPLVIYKGKTVQQQWFPLDLVPYDGREFTATDIGKTTDETAVEWLQKVFLPQTTPQPGQARLLQARLAGLTKKNIISGWKYTGLWPVAVSKPLMSSLLLPKATTPLTPLNKAAQGIQGIQDAQDVQGIEVWASASSAVAWSTPKKIKELNAIQKGQKGFQETFFQLATAQHQIQLLQAQVSNTAARKRKAVQIDPNTKFANISDIRQAQLEAGEVEINADESSASDCPIEAESCIAVASGPRQ